MTPCIRNVNIFWRKELLEEKEYLSDCSNVVNMTKGNLNFAQRLSLSYIINKKIFSSYLKKQSSYKWLQFLLWNALPVNVLILITFS